MLVNKFSLHLGFVWEKSFSSHMTLSNVCDGNVCVCMYICAYVKCSIVIKILLSNDSVLHRKEINMLASLGLEFIENSVRDSLLMSLKYIHVFVCLCFLFEMFYVIFVWLFFNRNKKGIFLYFLAHKFCIMKLFEKKGHKFSPFVGSLSGIYLFLWLFVSLFLWGYEVNESDEMYEY